MGFFEAALLGMIQGLTEFLPVSSSGHLVVFQHLLGFKEPELFLDSALHVGTLVAVCIFFHRDLKEMTTATLRLRMDDPQTRLVAAVLIGSIPTALIGLVFKEPLEALFASVSTVGIMLIMTGIVLTLTGFVSKNHARLSSVPWYAALAVGVAQGLAITPGISRSGATIAAGLFLGLNRELAGRYSFLLAIPAIFGALLLQLGAENLGSAGLLPVAAGFCTAALVGLFALKVLMAVVRQGRLAYFAPYCFALGATILIF